MSISLFKDDYETVLNFKITGKGRTIPLVGSKVFFSLVALKGGKTIGGGQCEIVDMPQGIARYKFKENELNLLGKYQGRVVVETPQGARRESIVLDMEIIE